MRSERLIECSGIRSSRRALDRDGRHGANDAARRHRGASSSTPRALGAAASKQLDDVGEKQRIQPAQRVVFTLGQAQFREAGAARRAQAVGAFTGSPSADLVTEQVAALMKRVKANGKNSVLAEDLGAS
jgi:hypothetical protein